MENITCISCGVIFGVPEGLRENLRGCHNTFYCPNGHAMHYPGKSDKEKAQEEAAKYKRWYESECKTSARLLQKCSALRGVITRTKNKQAEAGVRS